MLELKNGCLGRGGKPLVEDFSFVAPNGRITCIVGRQGHGKTCLIRAMMGLWPLTGGYASINGEPVTPHSAPWLRQLMAYVPQVPPEPYVDALDVLRELPVEGKDCVLVDDPFAGVSGEGRAETVADGLRRFADKGLAVLVTCGEEELTHLNVPEIMIHRL